MSCRPYLKYPFVILACVALSACSSKADRIETGLRKGAAFVREADWDKAGVEVRNVLQIDPKNASAFLLAGQVDDGRAALRSAYANYSKALELKPELVEAKLGLARLHLLVGEVPPAEKLLTEALAAEPTSISGRTLMVALHARKGEAPQALAAANQLAAAGPALPIQSCLELAGFYASVKDNATALRVLDKALAATPQNLRLLQLAAEIAADTASSPDIAAKSDGYFSAAVAVAPKNGDLWKAWAQSAARRGQTDRAEKILRDAVAAAPDDSARTLSLFGFLRAFRDAAVVEKEMAAAVAAKPKEPGLRFALADYYRRDNRVGELKRVLDDTVASFGKDSATGLTARSQLAGISLAAGQVDEARRTLDDVLKLNARDSSALVLRGQLFLLNNRPTEAISDLRAAAKDRPGSADIVALLSQAHRAAGEPQLARETLVDAEKLNPEDPQLSLLVAADLATEKDFRGAIAKTEEASQRAPKFLRAYQMRFELAMASKDLVLAEKTALDVLKRFPTNPTGQLMAGRLYATQKRIDPALKAYDAAAQIAQASEEPLIAAVSLLTGERRFVEARARVDAWRSAQPKSALGPQMLGELALAQSDLPTAERAFREVLAADKPPMAVYKNLAFVLGARKDPSGAADVMAQGVKAYPDNLEVASTHAEWLLNAGRVDESVAAYEALIKRAPNSDSVANNLATVLTEAKGDPASLKRALDVAKRFEAGSVPGTLDTLAMVHYRMGSFEKSATLMQRAVELAPKDPMLKLHLGMALIKKGDPARGKNLIRQALDSKARLPNEGEAKLMLAQG